ncbi:phosphomevalonate kinase, partial [Tulasnella sp. 427]
MSSRSNTSNPEPTLPERTGPTAVSAPGKVLLAGGYLVLDPKYSGVVVSTSARFYTFIRERIDGHQAAQKIVVRSPQFLRAAWSYTVVFTKNGTVGLVPNVENSLLGSESKNKFVQLALERVLFLAIEKIGYQALKVATDQGLEVIIVGDNDFYSQRNQLAERGLPNVISSLAQIPRFAPTDCSLADVHKTGLGSSAALITSLVTALMVQLKVISAGDLSDDPRSPGKTFVHNVAQYVHCLAQGKVGSGFDVSSATFGSQLYTRFAPEVLQPLMGEQVPSKLQPILIGTNKQWNQQVKPFKLPPQTSLMLADVDAGTDTPAAVGRVLSWKKSEPQKSLELWTQLGAANDQLAAALSNLTAIHGKNPAAYSAAVSRLCSQPPKQWAALSKDEVTQAFALVNKLTEVIRGHMRDMGRLSQVPIEPPEQTRLLDACLAKNGVIGGGVPGAGGYDAIWILTLAPAAGGAGGPTGAAASPSSQVESVWTSWKEMNVSPLSCGESMERGIELIWKKPLSPVSCFFLFNRYVAPVITLIDLWQFGGLATSVPANFCHDWLIIEGGIQTLCQAIAHLLATLRIRALLGARRWVDWVLIVTGMAYLAGSTLATTSIIIYVAKGYEWSPILHVCFGSSMPPWLVWAWIPGLVFETILFGFLVAKAYQDWRQDLSFPITRLLYRDGFISYMVIASSSLFNTIAWAVLPSSLATLAKTFTFCLVVA